MSKHSFPSGHRPLIFSSKKSKDYLSLLDIGTVIDLLFDRVQSDDILSKSLSVLVQVRLPDVDWEQLKSTLDNSLSLPDYVPHSVHGYELILDSILKALDYCLKNGGRDLALKAAEYVLEKGEIVGENIDENWCWSESLKSISDWVAKLSQT
ncbi:MAG: hypothetical protein ABIQ95_15875 [Bdellovibrionia bacterium]